MLLVASRYLNHATPLWNLPGGRQREGELLPQTLAREFFEETGLSIVVGALLYLSESYDGATHFLNATFAVSSAGEPRVPAADAHVVAFEWVPRQALGARLSVAVVREPLLAALGGDASSGTGRSCYFGFADAGITIEFADSP